MRSPSHGVWLTGMEGTDPLGFLSALGALRVLSESAPDARLRWSATGRWVPVIERAGDHDPIERIVSHLEQWREHPPPGIAFAVGADRKIQDLKHLPAAYRTFMEQAVDGRDRAWTRLAAAYATGVVVDGYGQTKPTSFHFAAGQQRFMDVVLSLLADVTADDVEEALFGPWNGRNDSKSLRWRAGGDRNRALLSFDPSKHSDVTIPGADWLAFQALPLFPVAPMNHRVRTPGFSGRGNSETFSWPLWEPSLHVDEIAALVVQDVAGMSAFERDRRGISIVLRSAVVRSCQGYGSFAPSAPI